MKNIIKNAYLEPNKLTYKIIEFKKKHFIKIIIFIILIILVYPAHTFIKTKNTHNNLKQKIIENEKILNHKKIFYDNLINAEKELHKKQYNLNNITQKIQELITFSSARLEYMQWNLEHGKALSFTLFHKPIPMFTLINELNKLPYVKFNQLTLIKNEQDKTLELNAILVLSQTKE